MLGGILAGVGAFGCVDCDNAVFSKVVISKSVFLNSYDTCWDRNTTQFTLISAIKRPITNFLNAFLNYHFC